MALSYVTGEFNIGLASGNITIDTGAGFEGKIIHFWWSGLTANGTGVNYKGGDGWAVSSTMRHCATLVGDDNLATTASRHGLRDNACIYFQQSGSSTNSVTVDFVSFGTGGDAGKFTLNRSATPFEDNLVKYEMFGGSEITNVFTGIFTGPAAGVTGNKAYTGVGFLANYLRTVAAELNTTVPVAGGDACLSIGQALSSTKRMVTAVCDDSGTTHASRAESYMNNALCYAVYNPDAGGSPVLNQKADFVSFDTDGFTMNHTLVTTGSVLFIGVLIKGTFQIDMGQTARPTATGDQDFTGAGFEPVGLSIVGGFPVTNDLETTILQIIQGAGEATGTVVDHSTVLNSEATINSNCDQRSAGAKVYTGINSAGTIVAEADLTAWLSNGFRLNWPTVDANARLFHWTAWGNAVAAETITMDKWNVERLEPVLVAPTVIPY